MIGLVSCSSQKLTAAAPARELYTSDLFRKSLEYAELRCARVYILSAKHGLCSLDEIIEPYNERLSQIPASNRLTDASRRWGVKVAEALVHLHGFDPELLVLAGRDYVIPLNAALMQALAGGRRGHALGKVHTPLAGMQVGERLGFLKRELEHDRKFRREFLGEFVPFPARAPRSRRSA